MQALKRVESTVLNLFSIQMIHCLQFPIYCIFFITILVLHQMDARFFVITNAIYSIKLVMFCSKINSILIFILVIHDGESSGRKHRWIRNGGSWNWQKFFQRRRNRIRNRIGAPSTGLRFSSNPVDFCQETLEPLESHSLVTIQFLPDLELDQFQLIRSGQGNTRLTHVRICYMTIQGMYQVGN